MKKIYIFLFIGAFAIVNAQTNLVPNPGFEIASPCPDYPGQTNRATGWNNVNLVYNNPSVGTPDFFHACGSATLGYNCVPPNTFSGICSPRTGNGFMSVVLYNVPYPDYREYFATQLTSPMTIGNTYTVSFWVTNGSTPYSPYIIKNIGVNFSTSPLSQTGWGLIALTPQCEVTTLVGGTTWQQYTFTVTATAAWQHITIGSFRSDSQNTPTFSFSGTSGPNSSYARYYFDDIAVLTNETPLSISELAALNNSVDIYPNPTSGTLNFISSKNVEEVKLYNIEGREVLNSGALENAQSIKISSLNNGMYFAVFYNEGRVIGTKKFIKE